MINANMEPVLQTLNLNMIQVFFSPVFNSFLIQMLQMSQKDTNYFVPVHENVFYALKLVILAWESQGVDSFLELA